jgi:hypothetical protein
MRQQGMLFKPVATLFGPQAPHWSVGQSTVTVDIPATCKAGRIFSKCPFNVFMCVGVGVSGRTAPKMESPDIIRYLGF